VKRALIPLAITLAVVGALAARVIVSGRAALAAGDAAAAAGDLDLAIERWESAARWYFPVAGHVGDAYARLIEITGKDRRHALAAWRAVRSAALATRGLWTPHGDDLAAANAAIAEIASRDPEGAIAGGADAAARKTFHTERLARDPAPSRGAVALFVLGIACFLAGIGLLLRKAGPNLVGAAVTVLGVVGWMIGAFTA
jgi:hypothetical protein